MERSELWYLAVVHTRHVSSSAASICGRTIVDTDNSCIVIDLTGLSTDLQVRLKQGAEYETAGGETPHPLFHSGKTSAKSMAQSSKTFTFSLSPTVPKSFAT